MSIVEWLQENIGRNWVIARRTPNILRRYGDDVICISKQRYSATVKEYRAVYGDPYDKDRAALYLALRDFADSFGHLCPRLKAQADAALEAERNAR